MKQFEILDISGDVGIRAFGRNWEELFENSAIGLYSLITNLTDIKAEKDIEISIGSNSIERLLVSWLNELIFHFDTYGFIGRMIKITEIGKSQAGTGKPDQPASIHTYKLKAVLSGDEFDPERHERKLLIKAATYHKLKIERLDDNEWQTDIIFDI